MLLLLALLAVLPASAGEFVSRDDLAASDTKSPPLEQVFTPSRQHADLAEQNSAPVSNNSVNTSAPTSASLDAAQPNRPKVPQMSPVNPGGYLAQVKLNSPEDLRAALERAEKLFLDGKVRRGENPLAFVIHGPEVAIFFQDNYQKYKDIVDVVARLTAFEVIELNVCRTRMGVLGRRQDALVPFVGTVPFGLNEIERLINEKQYVYF